MKVIIPENIADITLRQHQELAEVLKVEGVTDKEVNDAKLNIFTGLTDDQISAMSQSDYEDLISLIDKAYEVPAEFKQRFTMNGIEFGFHPNLDRMSTDEFVDLMTYNDDNETLHKLMAILFRPITKKDKSGNYKIAKYNGTDEMCEYMLNTPLSIVNGALLFFLNLSRELQRTTLKYSSPREQRKAKKHQIFGLNGGGLQRS